MDLPVPPEETEVDRLINQVQNENLRRILRIMAEHHRDERIERQLQAQNKEREDAARKRLYAVIGLLFPIATFLIDQLSRRIT